MTKKNTVDENDEEAGMAKYIGLSACATRFGISQRTWRRLVDAGRAPKPIRLGWVLRWSIAQIEEWEATQEPNQEKR